MSITRSSTRRLAAAALSAACVVALTAPAQASPKSGDASVHRFSDLSTIDGAASSLSRQASGVTATVRTRELAAGHAVTLWWVVFNDPSQCNDTSESLGSQCGPGDLPPFGGDDSAVTSLLYAAGHIVGETGGATFAARLRIGDDTDAMWGPGLIDPAGAEIHLVVRDHGEKRPGETDDAIRTFGACNPECVDTQFAIHVAS